MGHLEVLVSSPEDFVAFHEAEQEHRFKIVNDIKTTD
jgi:hypothetical protein